MREGKGLAESNAFAYAEHFLRGYRKMISTKLAVLGITEDESKRVFPLYGGQLNEDFSVSLFCEPFGTWVFFTAQPKGQIMNALRDLELDADWHNYTTGHQKLLLVQGRLGVSDAETFYFVQVSSPGFLCEDREWFIPQNAEAHGRDAAQQHAFDYAMRVPRERKRHQWEEAVSIIVGAIDAAGTQEAGVRFQEGMTRVLELAGWEPRDVRIVGQQIDASCFVGGTTPALVEMVNSKARAEASEVRDLFAKLQARLPMVVGILCAPGGVTAGAVKEAERFASQRAILLWSRAEIDSLLVSPDSAEEVFKRHLREVIDRIGGQLAD